MQNTKKNGKKIAGDTTINKLGYICVCSRTLRMTSYANCNLKLLAQAKYFGLQLTGAQIKYYLKHIVKYL